jgi:hypothetical protein
MVNFSIFLFIFIFTIINIFNRNVEACEQVCFYGNGDGQGDSGGHNSGSDYAYNFKNALGHGCSVEGSAETSIHCPGMTNCQSHSWWAGSDC